MVSNDSSVMAEVEILKAHSKIFGEENQGEPVLVLLHGWSNSVELITPLAESLGRYFKVLAIDLPGHGKSEVPKEVWDMKAFAYFLKKRLDEEGIDRAYFVGHSFGGKTIIKFADLFPEYVEKLVLIGASGLRLKSSIRKQIYYGYLKFLRSFIRFKNTEIGKKIYENWYIPKYASRDYKKAGELVKTFVRTVNEDLSIELKKIESPALLLWGENDQESPVRAGVTMNSYLKNSKLVILENRDHFPFLGSGQSLVTKYIRDFLKGV